MIAHEPEQVKVENIHQGDFHTHTHILFIYTHIYINIVELHMKIESRSCICKKMQYMIQMFNIDFNISRVYNTKNDIFTIYVPVLHGSTNGMIPQ